MGEERQALLSGTPYFCDTLIPVSSKYAQSQLWFLPWLGESQALKIALLFETLTQTLAQNRLLAHIQ
jgi:hypothetical protein